MQESPKTFSKEDIENVFPWLSEQLKAFHANKASALQFEQQLPGEDSLQYFTVSFSKMLDVSGKFTGTLVILEDITERRQMEEKLHELSITDELTGLFNRRGSLAMADKLVNICKRGNCELIVLFIDFDNLKWVNDSLGHKAGDSALIDTAEILRSTFRQADVIGRLGGDEFIVLITDKADAENEDLMIGRLKENLQKMNALKGRKFEISFSIGVARYDQAEPCSLDEILSMADQRMYANKQNRKKAGKGLYNM